MKSLLPKSNILVLVLLLVLSNLEAQDNPVVDSLLKVISLTNDNVVKADALCSIANEYKYSNPKIASTYANKAQQLSQKAKYLHGEIMAMNILAVLDQNKGNYLDALTKLKDALEIANKENDTKAIAHCFLSIGDVYSTLKSYDKAISNYEKSAALSEQAKDDQSTIAALGRIGNRNMDKGNEGNDTSYIVKAIAIYEHARQIAVQIKDDQKIIDAYINLADAYIIFGKKTGNRNYYFWSIDHSLRSLKLARESKVSHASEAISLLNMGEAYENLGLASKAIHYYELALEMYKARDDKYWIMNIHKLLAKSYLSLDNYPEAVEHLETGIGLAKKDNLKVYLRDYYSLLTSVYFQKNDFKNAFAAQQAFINYKDSIINENTSISIARLQTELELDKKDLEIELLNKSSDIQNEKIKTQTTQRNFLIAGFVLALILLVIFYYR